jgi:hypothetical protein
MWIMVRLPLLTCIHSCLTSSDALLGTSAQQEQQSRKLQHRRKQVKDSDMLPLDSASTLTRKHLGSLKTVGLGDSKDLARQQCKERNPSKPVCESHIAIQSQPVIQTSCRHV